ncbi:MAG: hypothetical protein AAF709_04820 [Pseudomonadota bacterium]
MPIIRKQQPEKQPLHLLDRCEVSQELKYREGRRSWGHPHLAIYTFSELLSAFNELRKEERRRLREHYTRTAQMHPDKPYWRKRSTKYLHTPKSYNEWMRDKEKRETSKREVRERARAHDQWQQDLADYRAGKIPRSSCRGQEIEWRLTTGNLPKPPASSTKLSPEQLRIALRRPKGPNGRFRKMTASERRNLDLELKKMRAG